MIHLLIADDHPIIREGLKQLFALTEDIVVVGEASQGEEVLACLLQADVDLLLLDMSMPGLSEKDLIAQLRASHPELPILVFSMHNEPQIARRALKAGASGYLTKGRSPEMLLAAIRKVAAGGRFLDPQLVESMVFESNGKNSIAHINLLTDREFQIFQLLAQGMGIIKIAARLKISNKTVSTHKANLMKKMGFASNTELVRFALENGLIH